MADALPPDIDRAAAIKEIDDWLVGALGAVALDASEVAAHQQVEMIHGWRIAFSTAGRQIAIDLLVDGRFPISKPEIFWIDAPPFPSIPHVEPNGRVCMLPTSASINPLEPVDVISTILAGVEDVIGIGLRGENPDDFRAEFRSYWNEVAKGREITSIVDPCEPSRMVRVWIGKKSIIMAENRDTLRHWLKNAYGKNRVADIALHRVPLIWLPQPLLPAEYPTCEADVEQIVANAGPDAVQVYENAILDETETTLVLFGADSGDGGICFGAIALSRKASAFVGPRRRVNGFRKWIPQKLLRLSRRNDSIALSAVARADAWWVHGRDTQDELETLLGATIVLIGCGSLGSPVARLLAQAGVGRLILIDPELMNFANAGRHALGVDAVHRHKAAALAGRLAREFPHLSIVARTDSWQTVNEREAALLTECDLLLSTIGDWEAECVLNMFLLTTPKAPPLIVSWAEPQAVAGHAIVISPGSGCLACGLSPFGAPLFRVANFERETLRREPACGAFFQPYGAGDIAVIAALTARVAIDALYGVASAGEHRVIAMPASDISAAGATLSDEWVAQSSGQAGAGNQIVRHWDIRHDCPYCRGKGA